MEILKYITPELILVLSAFALTMVGAFRKKVTGLVTILAAMAIAASFDASFLLYGGEPKILFNGLFVLDSFALYSKMLILFCSFAVTLMAMAYGGYLKFELVVLVLLATSGMVALVSANDLMSLYMAIELTSLSLYVLAASVRGRLSASEAGLKYFMLGALASGILLFGCSFIYGFSGTTNFTKLGELYTSVGSLPIEVLTGLILVMIGLFFKISAVPFHMWTPDVYQGSNRLVSAFLATAPKVAVFAVMIRLLLSPFSDVSGDWGQIVTVVALASIAVGAFGALMQSDIKRLMAYSSIGHVGFALLALLLPNGEQIQAVMTYLTIYVIATIGAWALIFTMRDNNEDFMQNITDLSGLAKYAPIRGFCFAIIMFSLAGIPPLAGFFAKFYVLKGLIVNDMVIQSVIAIILSVVSAYYYLRIIKLCYFDTPPEEAKRCGDIASFPVKFVLFWTVLANIIYIIWPWLIESATAKLFIF